MPSRIERCMKRASADEKISEKDMKKKIKSIDENRAKYYEYYTSQEWGARQNYDIFINTSGRDIAKLAEDFVHMLK